MARTPLFGILQRSLRLANRSIATGVPLDELLERARSDRTVSRRQFVAGASVTAAAGALAACSPSGLIGRTAPATRIREPDDADVLIVGAGIAGLTAAWRLRQAGVAFRLFEAQNRTGGRMWSLRNFFPDGQVCELGGELIDTPHSHIRRLATELGIELDDLATDDPSLRSETFYFDGRIISEREVAEAFLPIAERIIADLAPLGADLDPTYDSPQGAGALDNMSIAEWLDGVGASGWIRTLLDVGYTTEYGLELDRQSALNLLLMIGTDPGSFEIFGESDERFHVHDGNDRIVSDLARRVHDAIETATVLEAITQRSDGRYDLAFRRDGSSVVATGTHVLLAMPFTMLRQVRMDVVLPPAKRRAIAELGYGTNAKLMVGFSSRPWRQPGGANGSVLTSLPFQLVWETSRLQDGASGILTNFSGGAHGVAVGQGTEAEQAARLVADLERIFPGVKDAHVGMKAVRFHWPSFQWTRGSYASYHPGQWTSLRGAEQETVDQLFFAGEHCSLEAQGFMEGGCETGEAAATAILASLGVRSGLSRRAMLRMVG